MLFAFWYRVKTFYQMNLERVSYLQGWQYVSQLFSQTRIANYSGHQELAKKNSKMALTLNHVGVAVGSVLFLLFVIFEFVLNIKTDP